MNPISPLDKLMLQWATLQPERCKFFQEFGDTKLTIAYMNPDQTVTETSAPKRVYQVYAPNISQYVNTQAGKWQMDDWKTVGVAPGLEQIDLTGLCHLMIAVAEALKDFNEYPRDAGLPPIAHPNDAYVVATQHLEQLLSFLEQRSRQTQS